MTDPSPPAPTRATVIGVRQPPARKLPNLTAARALRTLEVLVFHAASAPGLAATMGIHDRTARRLLHSLEDEGYLQRGQGSYRKRHTYSPTPRLLALAGQLAARLPLITHGAHTVRQLRQATGLDAYFVVPSYGDVIVLARAGDRAPALWSLLPATDSAGGSVLLAYRHSWRDAQRPIDDHQARLDLEARAAEVRRDGYAVNAQGNTTSLAVPVPMDPAPLAALVLSSDMGALRDNGHEALLTVLLEAARRLNDSQSPTRSRRA
jgi:DNA-binding IclR family transcriptional regulator